MIRFAMLVVLFSAGDAVAQIAPVSGNVTAAQPAVVSTTKNAKSTPSANRMVCEDEDTLGTRLGAHRVCKTAAQWSEERAQTRVEVDRAQNTRNVCDAHVC